MTGKVRGVNNIFYARFLCLYLPGGTQKQPLYPTVAGSNQECETERIVSHKKARGRTAYQII